MDWEPYLRAARERAPLRIGAVRSAWSEPLLCGLLESGLVFEAAADAAALAEHLVEGLLDCALLPVLNFTRLPRLMVVPGLGMAVRGPSSVEVLLARKPVNELGMVGYDPRSGGAEALARIVLAEFYGVRAEFVPMGDAGAIEADAVLLSGGADAGWSGAGTERLDLGEVWREATGLPWVDHVWIARREANAAALRGALSSSLRRGEALSGVEGGAVGPLRYRLGADEADSMRLFLVLAAKHGLCGASARLVFC